MKVKFFGTRGSLPGGLTAVDVENKIVKAIMATHSVVADPTDEDKVRSHVRDLSFPLSGTYGGDTTCCVVRCDDVIIVIDMGSGLRRFGKEIIPEMFKNKGLRLNFLMSHIHWDHIQGFPFFGPLFIPREVLPNNVFTFYGGTSWKGTLSVALRGQMDPPVFPVDFNQVSEEGPRMEYVSIKDRYQTILTTANNDKVFVRCRRLNHPNDTYGWRIDFKGKSFAFCSDTEPYPGGPDPQVLDVAGDVDLLYSDCQYTLAQYLGQLDNVSRRGWGHGYVEWCLEVAREARVKRLLLAHHDPAATDEQIFDMEQNARGAALKTHVCDVRAAYDGMEIEL